MNLFHEDQKLPDDKRYFWVLRMHGNVQLVVTSNPFLASLIHKALYLVCDFTFKRLQGELNEWEVAIFHLATRERTSFVSCGLSQMIRCFLLKE